MHDDWRPLYIPIQDWDAVNRAVEVQFRKGQICAYLDWMPERSPIQESDWPEKVWHDRITRNR